jgi:hypothetical protein
MPLNLDALIRLLVLVALGMACALILQPFAEILLWAGLLALGPMRSISVNHALQFADLVQRISGTRPTLRHIPALFALGGEEPGFVVARVSADGHVKTPFTVGRVVTYPRFVATDLALAPDGRSGGDALCRARRAGDDKTARAVVWVKLIDVTGTDIGGAH